MGSYINWTVALVIIGLFTVAIIGFAINFASDNDSAIDISDDSQISGLYTTTRGNLSNFREKSEDTYTTIINSTIEAGDETSTSGAQFKITPATAIAVVVNILNVGYIKIFGTSSGFGIFITSFLALITFIFAFLLIKAWLGRSPD